MFPAEAQCCEQVVHGAQPMPQAWGLDASEACFVSAWCTCVLWLVCFVKRIAQGDVQCWLLVYGQASVNRSAVT